ncbi:hypothetical protein QA601_11000 [Chitinispirillales bacterium ANBcel5]|uniref:hypothetical protein n=1 Tax=Cellulosispirillum alkaliphilum TaxID=3039283 RepID=UPI002A50D1B7|nr:hypothetical protein [Chitinispirillales bacterium ANBcel5]
MDLCNLEVIIYRSAPVSACFLIFVLILSLAGCLTTIPPQEDLVRDTQNLLLSNDIDFDSAITRLGKIADSIPYSSQGMDAQFTLATLYISPLNPTPDYHCALVEFTTFFNLYPYDSRAKQASAWVRLLKHYIDSQRTLENTLQKLTIMEINEEKERKERKQNLESLAQVMKNCYAERDSLENTIQSLREVILQMERKYLKRGR